MSDLYKVWEPVNMKEEDAHQVGMCLDHYHAAECGMELINYDSGGDWTDELMAEGVLVTVMHVTEGTRWNIRVRGEAEMNYNAEDA